MANLKVRGGYIQNFLTRSSVLTFFFPGSVLKNIIQRTYRKLTSKRLFMIDGVKFNPSLSEKMKDTALSYNNMQQAVTSDWNLKFEITFTSIAFTFKNVHVVSDKYSLHHIWWIHPKSTSSVANLFKSNSLMSNLRLKFVKWKRKLETWACLCLFPWWTKMDFDNPLTPWDTRTKKKDPKTS